MHQETGSLTVPEEQHTPAPTSRLEPSKQLLGVTEFPRWIYNRAGFLLTNEPVETRDMLWEMPSP